MEIRYYAKDLVTFVKYSADESRTGEYLFIGYLNNNETKFKDLRTGNVFPLRRSWIHPDKPTYTSGALKTYSKPIETTAIDVAGQSFIQVEMSVRYHTQGVKYRSIEFSTDNCVFAKIKAEPFAEFSTHEDFPHLYDYVIKKQDSTYGIVTRNNIIKAANEANQYAEHWLYFFGDNEQNEDLDFTPDDITITHKERDF